MYFKLNLVVAALAVSLPTIVVCAKVKSIPTNIIASQNYSSRIKLNWDSIPGSKYYTIVYSESSNGEYSSVENVSPSGKNREEFSHNIHTPTTKSFYYKIRVKTKEGVSDYSPPVEGTISKMIAPKNLSVPNNQAATTNLIITWNSVPYAEKYRIYRATLMHRNAVVGELKNRNYHLIAEVTKNTYSDPLTSLPIRRYVYKITALDADGKEGNPAYTKDFVSSEDKTVYRLPVDVTEFLKDVDTTIIEAQSRIPKFGGTGSKGNPKGRAFGSYNYSAGIPPKSEWLNYTSFEITLNGSPKFKIDVIDFTASQTGEVKISGLFTGTVSYNALKGAIGGFTTGGSITATYNHPTLGVQRRTYEASEAALLLKSVRGTNQEAIVYPSYEKGSGGVIQRGGHE